MRELNTLGRDMVGTSKTKFVHCDSRRSQCELTVTVILFLKMTLAVSNACTVRRWVPAAMGRPTLPAQGDYVQIGWEDLKNLPSDRVDDFLGAPVMVLGFLSHQVKVETGGESTNCHKHAPDQVDWHMYFTKSPAQGIADAIIVETTRRTRPVQQLDN